jgi:hypothetical protein
MLDLGGDAIPLQRYDVVRKPQGPITGLREPSIPLLISLRLVERAVEFDDQPGGVAAEVGDEGANRDLASEVKAMKTAQRAQPCPQPSLRRRRLVAQAAREFDVHGTAHSASGDVADGAPHP